MKYVSKSTLNKADISAISADLPDLKNLKETKSITIGKWLTNVIKSKKIMPNTILPAKPDLAYILGVSIGTVQNAIRYVEDLGYVESKQCIGTVVKNRETANNMRKLTSKREIAIDDIKKYILDKNFKIGDALPSSRIISKEINSSANTTRLALEYLGTQNILERNRKCDKIDYEKTGWKIKSLDFAVNENKSETLVNKVEDDLKQYISDNLKIGDRIPVHSELIKLMSASLKTVNDAIKSLINEGILLTRRGRYGTTVSKMPYDNSISQPKETSIFAPAKDTAFYYYEKTQNYIRKMISDNYQIGEKLPSVNELSEKLDLSQNTIRKALQNLAQEGYLHCTRGRYGGTFVVDIPESNEQTFKWLAVSPTYTEAYKK